MRARFFILLGLVFAANPALARKWEVHPNPCPVPAAAAFKPEADVVPADASPLSGRWLPEDIYVEAPGLGREIGPVYLRLDPDALSEPAPSAPCETEEAPQ